MTSSVYFATTFMLLQHCICDAGTAQTDHVLLPFLDQLQPELNEAKTCLKRQNVVLCTDSAIILVAKRRFYSEIATVRQSTLLLQSVTH